MDVKLYCDYCEDFKNTDIRTVTKCFTIKSKKVTVTSEERYCTTCNNAVYDDVLDQNLSHKAIKQYNQEHGIPGESIKFFRKRLGLNQEPFSKLLGISRKTLISYEKEMAIPEESNARLLNLVINEPKCLYHLAKQNHSQDSEQKIAHYLNINDDQDTMLNEFNGYKRLDKDLIKTFITYFSEQSISMTRLNKGLFYLDFNYFQANTVSLTGLTYLKQTYGPFSSKIYELVSELLKENQLMQEPSFHYDDDTGKYHTYITKEKIKLDNLHKDTIDLLIAVKKYLHNNNATSVSDDSHQEEAWQNTAFSEPISYKYASTLINIM